MTHQKIHVAEVAPLPMLQQRRAEVSLVAPVVRIAQPRWRHRIVLLSFFVCVVFPVAAIFYFLWHIAEDQFASTVGFSVRREEVSSAVELLGGVADLSGSSSSDTDILFEFVRSQKLVAKIDDQLGLSQMWSKPTQDRVFGFEPGGTIEDLVDHWSRLVKVSYDTSSKLIEIRVHAFAPEDAQAIAQAIFNNSSAMINQLSAIAREDAVRYARDELKTAVERLKAAREAVTEFRNTHQIVDPNVDVQTQAGLLGNLQSQLAEALISLDLLTETTRTDDPRIEQAQRKVHVIEGRIKSEKNKLGLSGAEQNNVAVFATVFGEYERLVVDREFAEQTYISALSAFDAAQAEAGRQSRYLAAHIEPTMAERSMYPQRAAILGLCSMFLVLIWAISVLVGFSLKDRR